MKPYLIKKGNHYCLHPIKLHYDRKRLITEFMFPDSCAYDLHSKDQFDWNKVVGLGFGFNHHHNSYRIGARFDPLSRKMELGHYYYNHKLRHDTSMVFVKLNQHIKSDISFSRSDNTIWNRIYVGTDGRWTEVYNNTLFFDFRKVPRWGFFLYPFQGGNEPAQHDTTYLLDIL